MKNYLIVVLTFCSINLSAQALEIGQQVPGFSLKLLGSEESEFTYSGKGKMILIDFWATWCSPCIASMPHLEKLQKEFGEKLQVIAVSEEDPERIERFIKNKPHKFLFAYDTGELRDLFPYQVIPHTILISPKGELIAVTSPDNINSQVIKEALAGRPIDLPVKKDNLDFDPTHDYFNTDTTVVQNFELQPFMDGIPAFSKTYHEGPFDGRRMTVFNLNIAGLYRHAYQISDYRVVYEFDESSIAWENKQNRFCMNVIVEDPSDLYSYAQEQLPNHSNIQATIDHKKMEVLVIKKAGNSVNAEESEESGLTIARGDGFKNTGASIKNFCEYLEDFGIVGMPVVDETEDNSLYNIDFSFDPENPESFKHAMKELGLIYQKAKREIEVLVLSKEFN